MATTATSPQVSPRSGVSRLGRKLRRSQRVALRVPVIVYTDPLQAHTNPGFKESTCVIRVSAFGGLVELAGELQAGDRFMLRHKNRNEETECCISYVQKKSGTRLAGFEFTRGLVDFWGISFPAVRS